jgi:2-dehydro-3-deoxyphosphogluconate aldolase/(4S)-4-hydroxy-2-oxoglutarate aldolase
VQAALRLGLNRLKLFPSGAVDARKLLGAYRDVFRDVRFMPSGGISAGNMTEFLALTNVFAVSGSWIVGAAADGADAVALLAGEAVARAASAEGAS